MRKTLGFGIFALLSIVACTQNYQSRVQIVDSPNENWVSEKSQFNSTLEMVKVLDMSLNHCPLCGLDVQYGLSQEYVTVLEHSRGISIGFSSSVPVMEHKIGSAKYDRDILETWQFTMVAWPANSYVMNLDPHFLFAGDSGRQVSRPGYFEKYQELKSFKTMRTEEFMFEARRAL